MEIMADQHQEQLEGLAVVEEDQRITVHQEAVEGTLEEAVVPTKIKLEGGEVRFAVARVVLA